jgi:hypothetical protein
VQRHPGRAGILGQQPRLDVREVIVVNALAHLDGDRTAVGGVHRRRHDLLEQPAFPGQRRTPTLPGDLRYAAPEVHVNVICEVLRDDHLDRLADRRWVDAVELEAAGALAGPEGDHPHGLRVPLDQCPGRDHLADVQAGTLLPAELAERHVGDPSHRCKHHRRVHCIRSEP